MKVVDIWLQGAGGMGASSVMPKVPH